MKYVDNLLDWGDSLFAEFTMESVNEATMLYVMAADDPRRRARRALGDCGEGDGRRRATYEQIAPLVRAARSSWSSSRRCCGARPTTEACQATSEA